MNSTLFARIHRLRFARQAVGLAALLVASTSLTAAFAAPARLRGNFDAGWRFLKADAPGAERPAFDDSAWRGLDVPHDWSIEGPFAETNRTGGAGGFLPAGVGWYRKAFTLPAEWAARRVGVEFDGVMANSEVWVNGFALGKRPYGYVSFQYDLTGHLEFGAGRTNVLCVRADNSAQPASRWYTGAGIYRHVRLTATDPVHLEPRGVFVTTPKVAPAAATVRVRATVVNQSPAPREVTVQFAVLDPAGKNCASATTPPQSVAPGQSAEFSQDLTVTQPQLWELERPALYRLASRVVAGGATLDEDTVTFGIREARFEADTGFWLNGRNFKLKGVCLHHDASALGAAVPLRAWERRLTTLKSLGVNAIRTAHNPPDPGFLDLCDRLGLLVMDELFDCWTVAKNPYDYHRFFNEWSKADVRDTVRRDRNHPSVILYSAGNEIHDTPKAELAQRILSGLVEVFHANDPSRPVTQALFRPNVSHDYDDGLADRLDVIGQNYRENEILAAHEQKPSRKIVGTENGHDRRGWLALRDHAPYAGQFLWTGIDYLGEARRWPTVAAGSGLLDRTATPRPLAFQRQSWWSDAPMVYLTRRVEPERTTAADPGFEPLQRRQSQFPDWSPRQRGPHDETVEVYSNCEEVELRLNGNSLGSQRLPADASPRVWKVPFAAGTIEALGKNQGRVVARHELRTAGPAAKLVLATDRPRLAADWEDVAYVSATITDARGVPVPEADDLITFSLAGPGVIAAVDSADNASHEPFQAHERHAFQGKCFAILKATSGPGQLKLTASAPGLASGTLTLEATAR